MTVAQAADSLGVTPRRVRALIASGRLAADKHGRDWWIPSVEAVRVRQSGRPAHQRKEPGNA